jgi:RNA repair pathway DNA polymerase beta family
MIKIKGLSQEQVAELIPSSPIIVGFRGSIAHGMYVPSTDPNSVDDKDLMSVCIPAIDFYFGNKNCGFGHRGVFEKWVGEYDTVSYELKKFVGLLEKSNPNVMSLLWLDPQYYIYVSDLGRRLIDSRELFVSKLIYHAFTGYAHGQLHRMTHQVFEGYMGQKRKGLVEKYGYDTKNAAHCVRLLRMGIEFLIDGVLYVDRSHKDGPELLEIKRGQWTLEQVKAEADRLFRRAEDIYAASKLPLAPDPEKVNELMVSMLQENFRVDPTP